LLIVAIVFFLLAGFGVPGLAFGWFGLAFFAASFLVGK